jgi:UDP-N-acetylmuramate dehydrogenase
MRTQSDVPLAPLTTLQVGGAAARLAQVEREEDVAEVVRDAEARGEPLFVLGGGSNVVVADSGFPGLVARIATRGIRVHRECSDGGRTIVDVAAGEDWDAFVERAVDEGWGGVACMSGIPGLVGATPIQNVGAYGQEVGDTLAAVRAFDREVGDFVEMDAHACGFGYRASIFKRNDRWIVTRVRFVFDAQKETPVRYAELARTLSVREGEAVPSRLVRATVLALRRAKGMVLDPNDADSVSAGSFFVNPAVDEAALAQIERSARERPPRFDAGPSRYKVPAAWLVERAGFAKGSRLGRAGVSQKHALALVNCGGASARDLLALARAIRDAVHARFGVELEPEPVLVGCSWEERAL